MEIFFFDNFLNLIISIPSGISVEIECFLFSYSLFMFLNVGLLYILQIFYY